MEDRTVAFLITAVGGGIQATVAILLIAATGTERAIEFASPLQWLPLPILGGVGLVLSLLVFFGAYLFLKNRRPVLGSAIVIACSLLSIPFTLGGAIGGMLFGLMGGLIGYIQTKPEFTRTD